MSICIYSLMASTTGCVNARSEQGVAVDTVSHKEMLCSDIGGPICLVIMNTVLIYLSIRFQLCQCLFCSRY